MNDLINRQDAIDAINKIAPVDTEYDCKLLDRIDVRYVLIELPSAQPEIVRCKDCKYGDVFLDKEDRLCLLTGIWKEPCHFCSDGERKTDND